MPSTYSNYLIALIVAVTINSFLMEFNYFVHLYSNTNKNVNNTKFKIYYQNVQDVHTKLFMLHSNLTLLYFDIYILTETWLFNDVSNLMLSYTLNI